MLVTKSRHRHAWEALKSTFGRALFTLANIERIHIIGCSRSGTTILHLAAVYFHNTMISGTETAINYPHLGQRMRIAAEFGLNLKRKYFVTKRNFHWFEAENVDNLVRTVRREGVGVIHIVRDPRDVMLSQIVGSKRGQLDLPYVSGQHWLQSIEAADRVFDALSDYDKKVTVRYEDLVLEPARIEFQLSSVFGMRPNPRAYPIYRVKDNFELFSPRIDQARLEKTGGLRNLEPTSIGRWRTHIKNESIELNEVQRLRVERFCLDHGYPAS